MDPGHKWQLLPSPLVEGAPTHKGRKGQPLSQNVHREQVWLGGGWSCDHHPPLLTSSPVPPELSRCSHFPTKAITMAHLEATHSNQGLTFSSIPEVLAGKGAKSEYLKPTISLLRELLPHGNPGPRSEHEPVNIWREPPISGGEWMGQRGCV